MMFKIRRAIATDVDEIISLCAEHAEYEHTTYSCNEKAEKLSSYLFCENPRLFCLIAENDKEVLGYATYMFEFSTWDADFYLHMDCLYLRPHARGFGMGEALIKEIVKAATENNCNMIQWQTPTFNKTAIKFYSRMGAISKEKLRFFLNNIIKQVE